jgi:hypothetical protein
MRMVLTAATRPGYKGASRVHNLHNASNLNGCLMNSAELDRLGRLMEESAVPEWVRSYVESHRDAMAAALNRGEAVVVPGPNGERIRIAPERDRSAA